MRALQANIMTQVLRQVVMEAACPGLDTRHITVISGKQNKKFNKKIRITSSKSSFK